MLVVADHQQNVFGDGDGEGCKAGTFAVDAQVGLQWRASERFYLFEYLG